jgi:hypothetical protein
MSNFSISNVNNGLKQSFEVSQTLTGIGASDWYILPAGVERAAVTVTPSGGASCVVQTTTDSIADIENDNNVTAVDWDAGSVSSVTTDTTAARVNAIRVVQTVAGVVKFTVNC